jgi:hypothetical protein
MAHVVPKGGGGNLAEIRLKRNGVGLKDMAPGLIPEAAKTDSSTIVNLDDEVLPPLPRRVFHLL